MNEPWEVLVSAAATTSAPPPLRDLFVAEARKMTSKVKVSGRGTVTHPPDAVARVRCEIEACSDPARRRELEEVLADLEKG